MYKCSLCGCPTTSWSVACPSCFRMGALVHSDDSTLSPLASVAVKFHRLNELKPQRVKRYKTGFVALDYALGGGLVAGSRVMLSGEAGIGKSTLLLQVAAHIQDTIYCAGEEPLEQIRQRAARLQIAPQSTIYLSNEIGVEAFLAAVHAFDHPPDVSHFRSLIVVDSIQAIQSDTQESRPGSPWQVAACAQQLADFAKTENIALLFSCQNDKGGDFAGPAAIAHLVDVHISFERGGGDEPTPFRLLHTHKNRYGPSGMAFALKMTETGLLDVS